VNCEALTPIPVIKCLNGSNLNIKNSIADKVEELNEYHFNLQEQKDKSKKRRVMLLRV